MLSSCKGLIIVAITENIAIVTIAYEHIIIAKTADINSSLSETHREHTFCMYTKYQNDVQHSVIQMHNNSPYYARKYKTWSTYIWAGNIHFPWKKITLKVHQWNYIPSVCSPFSNCSVFLSFTFELMNFEIIIAYTLIACMWAIYVSECWWYICSYLNVHKDQCSHCIYASICQSWQNAHNLYLSIFRCGKKQFEFSIKIDMCTKLFSISWDLGNHR